MRLNRREEDRCVSDYIFDQRVAGDLDTKVEREVAEHLAECDRCGERWAAISAAHATFSATPSRRASPLFGRRSWYWVNAVAATMAVAAGLFIFLKPVPGPPTASMGERIKGRGQLGFFVKRGDHVRAGVTDEPLFPGDALRFTFTANHDGYLTIVSLDGANKASIYYPTEGSHAAKFSVGSDVPLPGSIVLDDTLGHERLFGVLCEEPIALEPLRARLEAAPEELPHPDRCSVTLLEVRKASPPR